MKYSFIISLILISTSSFAISDISCQVSVEVDTQKLDKKGRVIESITRVGDLCFGETPIYFF